MWDREKDSVGNWQQKLTQAKMQWQALWNKTTTPRQTAKLSLGLIT
jgi:hypothetical protein